jgi:glycosyltransferase involved in cell wall biosynthesis
VKILEASSAARGREAVHAALSGKQFVLDCRWLALGGAGRLTELLLQELRETPPPGKWVLWGPPEQVESRRFTGAVVRPARSDPRRFFGQRDFFAVPSGDVVLYMHQIRPLRPGRSVTFILDTIPLRYGGGKAARLAKRAFFHAAATLSSSVLTISELSRKSIQRDLGLPSDDVRVVPLPVDTGRARAVADLRDRLGQEEVLLYVGRFDRHKNLERLCRAFVASRFGQRGGRLLLVGGWSGETEALHQWIGRNGLSGVDVRPQCSEAELDALIATSRALILPSLEEGFGLPAFEASASGLPVAASRTGAMTQLSDEEAVLFDPLDVEEMAAAIDVATARQARSFTGDRGPGLRDAVLESLAHALARHE